jgi:uncharacterized membrane protein
MKANDDSRRLLNLTVYEADIPSKPKEVLVSASLFRVQDDKEIDKEKGTSPSIKYASGKTTFNWSNLYGKTFNLNNESGLPSLKIFVYSKKTSMMSSTKTQIGMIEIDLDELPAEGGEAEWKDFEGGEKGRLKVKASFSKDIGEEDTHGAVLTIDEDYVPETDEELIAAYKEAQGGKKKSSGLPKAKILELCLKVMEAIPKGITLADVEARYDKFGGGKTMNQSDFVEFYKTIRPDALNELQIVVIKARNLRAADGTTFGGTGSSDPFVSLKMGKKEQKTKVIKKDLNPFWNEKFSLRAVDPMISLVVIVSDYNAIGGSTFLGRNTISLKTLLDKESEPEWFELRDSSGNKDTKPRGEVQLMLKWRHNPDVSFKPFELADNGDDSESEDEENNDDGEEGGDNPDANDDETKEAKAKSKEKEDEAKENLSKDQENYKVISGDYQLHVHIIEGRDFKAKDLNGMSDPFVTVEAFGQKFNTAVITSTLNPVFDDLLIFNIKGLDKEEFEEGLIKVTVKDSDFLTSNDMIGSYSFDATYVYYQANHELYKSWIGLINEKDLDDDGVQGYLKLSIQIVGPNDKLKIHRESEETSAAKEGDDIGSMVLMPPTIKREQKWLLITAHCAEYLPMLDAALGAGGFEVSSSGIDAFYRAEFSDSVISSNVVSVKGKSRHQLNPEWHFELWIPISTPSATNKIKHSVWDYDTLGSNDVAGIFYTKLKDVEKKKKIGPTWKNLYGAPTVATSSSATLATSLGGGVDYKKKYNEFPDLASTYRGRVLMSAKIRPNLPKKEIENDRPFKVWKRKVKTLDLKKYPKTDSYVLKLGLMAGSELPQLRGTIDRSANRKLGVIVSCGKYQIIVQRADNLKGCCEWAANDSVAMPGLPRHDEYPDQFPDVFIYLYTGKTAKEIMPICFTRIPAIELINEEFSGEFKWYTLQEDKALDKLGPKTFPGCLLLRLGLGTAKVAAETETEWNKMTSSDVLSQKVPYIVRVNIYQCRSLPAADSNGLLDPYLKVNVLGAVQITSKKSCTRDPMYYESFDFKTEINHNYGLQLAPRVCIQVWDHDWGMGSENDDYCGCCMLDLKDAFVDASSHMDQMLLDSTVLESLPKDLPEGFKVLKPKKRLEGRDLPDPLWVDFMIEKEGDGEGQLLASVQLIPSAPGHANSAPQQDIKPDSRPAFLEITTLGCRNLIPYNFLPITLPRLEFVLETADETITQSSPQSKKPSPQNPNYLRYDIVPVARFPEKSIFAPRLMIKAYDTRLGGLSKPNIGNCSVALETKIPWDLSSYVAYESTFAAPPEPVDEEETKLEESDDDEPLERPSFDDDEDGEFNENDLVEADEDDLINKDAEVVALPEPVGTYKERLTEMAGAEDSGLGVFGALKHLEKERAAEDALLEEAFGAEEAEEEDEPDKPPAYMIDRQILDGTLEDELVTTPFETFHLELGQGKGVRSVGCFKGLIRVFDHEPTKEEAPFDLQLLLKPQSYKVRLYILRGMKLAPMDPGWGGRPGKSDPYLHVTLGKEKHNGRKDYVDDATDVDFYQMIELNAELPGAGQMIVKVMDYDTFGTDDLIGRTVVDLEDRWFDQRWQDLGTDTMNKEPESLRWKAKPLEVRPLKQPPETKGSIAQGYLELWVDVLLPAEATAFPPDDVSLPPTAIFEVRIIIWKAKNVVSMDSLTNMNDTYVKAFIEGTEKQTTDIHWRAKKGKASWNWRMKFDVQLGHNTRTMKFPYLNLSMWDKDILKYDDVIAETVLDLGKYFKRAYKKGKAVKLFDDAKKKPKKAKKKAPPPPSKAEGEEEKQWKFEEPNEVISEKPATAAASTTKKPEETKTDNEPVTTTAAEGGGGGEKSLAEEVTEIPPEESGKSVEDDLLGDDDVETGSSKQVELTDTVSPLHQEDEGGDAQKEKEHQDGVDKTNENDDDGGGGGGGCCGMFGSKKEVDSDSEDAPLLDAEAKEKAGDDKEAADTVSMIKGLFGLGEDDPPDSTWLHMTIKDFKNDERIPMGKLCLSVNILPKAEAKISENGFGRREPNHSPLLPPPVGRLKWSWNPFVMGSQLCGPKLCFYFTCCLIASVIIVLMVFCQPVMNLIISISIKLLL